MRRVKIGGPAICALGFALWAIASTRAFAGNDAVVTTLGGSGTTGYADGPGRSASFMLPMGVALDSGGRLYVADAAAQRIRVVSNDGVVRTIAGSGEPDASGVWVPGGYRDGPGADARFNRPAALAVARGGRIFVADTYNHCIRVIAPDGTVGTWVGAPDRPGLSVGSRAGATFELPTGLAIDQADNLYVVDVALRGSVRKIDPSGSVSDLPIGDRSVQPQGAIALFERAGQVTMFVATLDGLAVRSPSGSVAVLRSAYYRLQCNGKVAPGWVDCTEPVTTLRSESDVGAPGALAAVNDHTVLAGDLRTDALRLIDFRYRTARIVAGSSREDGSGRGGGSQDGVGTAATFNAPYGLVFDSRGSALVGDAGSRKIRRVTDIDTADALLPDELDSADLRKTTVLYAGTERIWQGTSWSDSIEGRLELLLHRSVVPVVLTKSSDLATVVSVAQRKRLAGIVLQIWPDDPIDVRSLRGTASVGKSSDLRLLVMATPSAERASFEGVSPENLAATAREIAPPDFGSLRRDLAQARVRFVDLTGRFRATDAKGDGEATYDNDGVELSAIGRELSSEAAAAAMRGGP